MEYKHNKNLVDNAKSLRKNMTKEERRLWYDYLRQYPLRFLRQKIIGKYIVDFYCPAAKLVIELDGSQHYEPMGLEKDTERTNYLSQFDITVVRIPNNEVMRNFRGVCEYIDLQIKQSPQSPVCGLMTAPFAQGGLWLTCRKTKTGGVLYGT